MSLSFDTPPPTPTLPAAIGGREKDEDFGIYLHWPFCAAKCPYCDFNSHVRHKPIDETRFLKAFLREIAHNAALTEGRTVTSIFFGGGTPSLMQPSTLGAILDAVAAAWTIAPNAEITLEANPTSVEATRFRDYRKAGINRVSLGIQALKDEDLRRLGRMHSAAEALDALKIASSLFDRYSFDLIYARPGHTPAAWERELREAFRYAGEHLSLYQLTIEPGTWYERLQNAGKLTIPDGETGRELYDLTQDLCEAQGLPAYEISNHARRGSESRHNLIYWRSKDYAGIGPGAHGRLTIDGEKRATATEKHPETWLDAVEAHGHGWTENEILSPEAKAEEFLMMGLRLTEGVDLARHRTLSSRTLPEAALRDLTAMGFLALEGTHLKATPNGIPVLNTILSQLLTTPALRVPS